MPVPEVEACEKRDLFPLRLFVVGVGASKESSRVEPEAGRTERWAEGIPQVWEGKMLVGISSGLMGLLIWSW